MVCGHVWPLFIMVGRKNERNYKYKKQENLANDNFSDATNNTKYEQCLMTFLKAFHKPNHRNMCLKRLPPLTAMLN